MSTRNNYHVLHDQSSGKWIIVLEKANKESAVLEVKEDAIRRAIVLARRNMPSQVIVHNIDGTVHRRYIYGDSPVKYIC